MSCFNPDLDGLFCLLVEFGLVDVEVVFREKCEQEHSLVVLERGTNLTVTN